MNVFSEMKVVSLKISETQIVKILYINLKRHFSFTP